MHTIYESRDEINSAGRFYYGTIWMILFIYVYKIQILILWGNVVELNEAYTQWIHSSVGVC